MPCWIKGSSEPVPDCVRCPEHARQEGLGRHLEGLPIRKVMTMPRDDETTPLSWGSFCPDRFWPSSPRNSSTLGISALMGVPLRHASEQPTQAKGNRLRRRGGNDLSHRSWVIQPRLDDNHHLKHYSHRLDYLERSIQILRDMQTGIYETDRNISQMELEVDNRLFDDLDGAE